MLEESERAIFEVPIGPQHPALKEPILLLFKIEGDTIVDVMARPAYTHRGVEKATEARNYIQNIYLCERVCGICSCIHTLVYTQGVERLVEVEPPPRAKYIRVIMSEFERIHSHMLWFGVAAHELGFDTLFYYVWRDRELVMDLLELISGNRVNYAMSTVGGVRRDISDAVAHQIKKGMEILRKRLDVYTEVVEKEPTLRKRVIDVGKLSPHDAVALCAVGPTLRMTGVKRDVRADDPYQAYDEIPFNVATYDTGDVLAQIIVRVVETYEAANIIDYAIDHMPSGPIKVKVPWNIAPNEIITRGEAPRGELFYYFKSNGTEKPERVKIRTPTLGNIPAVCEMLKGYHIAEIPIVFAGIDPCLSCTARFAFIDERKGKSWVWSGDQLRTYRRKYYKRYGR
ncbi:MAG: hydrogenase large subunit [Candidatus Hecatellaceae archaeon]